MLCCYTTLSVNSPFQSKIRYAKFVLMLYTECQFRKWVEYSQTYSPPPHSACACPNQSRTFYMKVVIGCYMSNLFSLC